MIVHAPDCPDRACCDCWAANGGRQTMMTLEERVEANRQAAAEADAGMDPDLPPPHVCDDWCRPAPAGAAIETTGQAMRDFADAVAEAHRATAKLAQALPRRRRRWWPW